MDTPNPVLQAANRWRILAYVVLSCWIVWPVPMSLGRMVPGAERTDIWNSLWSLWMFQHGFWGDGETPFTDLINFPHGGILVVADPVNALLATPLIPVFGLPLAYTFLVVFQLTLAGLCAHAFADELIIVRDGQPAPMAGWIAGVGFATAPILLSGIHNGTSESFAGGWVALAAWQSWRAARLGGHRRVITAIMALLVASLASWYAGVVAFFFAGALLLVGAGAGWRRRLGSRIAVVLGGVTAVTPFAALVRWATEHPDNLVRIKGARELAGLRRSTGVADPLGFLMPGDFRSPDFSVLSRYGEAFIHCHYLGYVLILGAVMSLWHSRRRQNRFLWIAAGVGLLLSMGPVVVRGGQPLILGIDRVIPLPYFLVEFLPGFSSLSLLYRLAMAPALALALLAAIGFANRRSSGWVVAAIVLEGWLMSPLGGLPDGVDVAPSPALQELQLAPEGAVMNFPVAGGRPYLYEQTIHQKPLTDTLNFPNNTTSQQVWAAILDAAEQDATRLRAMVGSVARREGVRYLVVHDDQEARPDMHDLAVAAIRAAYVPHAEDERIQVYKLW